MAKTPARKPLPSSFAMLGAKQYEAPTKKSIVMTLDGEPNTGKTEVALQAPDPMVYFSFDRGLKDVINKHLKKRAIGVFEYELPSQANQANSAPIWNAFFQHYYACLANPDVLTIVLDKGSDVWDLLRMSLLGAYEKVPPLMYKQSNSEYRQLFRAARTAHKNLIVIHEIEDEYKSQMGDKGKEVSVKTGGWKRDGFSKLGFLVDAEILCQREKGTKNFNLLPMTCKSNMNIVGEELTDADCSFAGLVEAIYGEPMDPEEWGM